MPVDDYSTVGFPDRNAGARTLTTGVRRFFGCSILGSIMRCGALAVTVLIGSAALVMVAPALGEKRQLTVEGKPPAEYLAGRSGETWALVIGIDEYEVMPPLRYAVADAQAVAALFEQQGFQVTALYNRKATRRGILKELGDNLLARAGENDRVVVYFAGHGETKRAKGGREMGYLMPSNARGDSLADSAISMGLIRDLADALPAKQVLFLMDVCYGGIAGARFRSTPQDLTEENIKQIIRERGRQLITAGGGDQRSLEGPEWEHSVFTYYLLQGLGKGLADFNDDGVIPASELFAYLDQRVTATAQLKGHVQRPELWLLAGDKGEFVFTTGKKVSAPEAERQPLEAEQQRRPIEEARRRPYSAPVELAREIAGKDGAPMALVDAGEFLMGSDKFGDEKPMHKVSLDAFYLDKYEITTARYAKFLEAEGRRPPMFWNQGSQTSYTERPVVGVDWHDADAYCRWAGKRLPTEAEWEKAARGADGRLFPWGNEEPTTRHANFGKGEWMGYSTLTPVGGFEKGKSPYGIYDMAGNVWEWVADWYEPRYYATSPSSNPQGASSGENKVLRGGSWNNPPFILRSTARNWSAPSDRPAYVGFRCAQGVPK